MVANVTEQRCPPLLHSLQIVYQTHMMLSHRRELMVLRLGDAPHWGCWRMPHHPCAPSTKQYIFWNLKTIQDGIQYWTWYLLYGLSELSALNLPNCWSRQCVVACRMERQHTIIIPCVGWLSKSHGEYNLEQRIRWLLVRSYNDYSELDWAQSTTWTCSLKRASSSELFIDVLTGNGGCARMMPIEGCH